MSLKQSLVSFLLVSLFVTASQAQEAQAAVKSDEVPVVEVIGQSSYLFGQKAMLQGVKTKINLKNGTYIPVSIMMGEGVKQIYAGYGITANLNKHLAYSVEAALATTTYDERYIMQPDYNKKFALMFNNEVALQLSKRLSLTAHYNADLIAAFKITMEDTSPKTMKQDMTTVGAGLKLNLGKKKKH